MSDSRYIKSLDPYSFGSHSLINLPESMDEKLQKVIENKTPINSKRPYYQLSGKGSLFLIGGRARAGKDTAGIMIQEYLKYLTGKHGVHEKFSFADPVKMTAAYIFGLSGHQVYGDEKDAMDTRWGTTPRRILQKFGTDVARNIDPNVWAIHLCHRILASIIFSSGDSPFIPSPAFNNNDHDERFVDGYRMVDNLTDFINPFLPFANFIVVPDLRFKNEIDVVQTRLSDYFNIYKIYINRGELPAIEEIATQHESENSLDNVPFDYEIVNTGTLDEFYDKIIKMIHEIYSVKFK